MTFPGGSETGDEPEENQGSQPGQVYDRAMRAIAAADPGAFCEWLEVPVDGERPELLSADFPAETLHADLVARVGPDRLLHVEFVRKPERDMAIRMVGYRAHLMRRHPGASISQFVTILGEGRLQSCDDPANGFMLGLRGIYVREREADPLLARPILAPVAVLAKGDVEARGQYLATAYKLAEPMSAGLRSMLRQAALDLATITLDRSTIDREWHDRRKHRRLLQRDRSRTGDQATGP